jgi:glucose/arabinose dehydrogenase
MRMKFWQALAAVCVTGVAGGAASAQQFTDQLVVGGWNQAVGVTFDANGRAYVWEKAGRVWIVENGIKSSTPLIDISEEVGDWRDYGLIGFALDPNFLSNGRIYLSYVVDYHHLMFFGTGQYSPTANQYFTDTIARLTRYNANPADGFRSVLPASRFVMLGETRFTGAPITHESHGPGTIVFGDDGTLLASFGEGASYDTADVGGFRSSSSNTALQDGILTPETDVGAMRAQQVDSLSGKIVRLDPNTGDGVPSNPFYNAGQPHSAGSRVWAMGLRNPFRMCIRPGSGSTNPASGNPGVLYVGDVGWSHHEELSVVPTGGLNLGWPLFEGLEADPDYTPLLTANPFAPNPLFGTGGCTIQHFRFQDLIKQEVVGTPSWPNPCNSGQQIAAGTPRFEHTRPIMDWGHQEATRVATFNGSQASWVDITSPSSPITGSTFHINSSTAIAGCWYSGAPYPASYNNSLFFGDFTGGWIYNLKFNGLGQPVLVEKFREDLGPVVCVTRNPADGMVYFISYSFDGTSNLRRFFYGVDAPPTAVASCTPQYGMLPASTTFSSAGSGDDTGVLTYAWDFGDGTPLSTQANPSHTYANVEDITATGTVVAKVLTLNPPGPQGAGSTDTNTIRDGVRPPVGTVDYQASYDTYHDGAQGTEDWIGYTFSSTRTVRRLLFQEGMEFGTGGWWDVLDVQARVGGNWVPVSGLTITPEYPAASDGVAFNTFTLEFTPVNCTGIRLYGVPGGNDRFMSVGELRVYATPVPATTPIRFDATLTVTDAGGQTATAGTFFTGNNTPPSVTITSPVNGTMVDPVTGATLPLTAVISDAQQPGQVTCEWQVILHHNAHTHPEPPINACLTSAYFSPHTGGAGDVIYYEVLLTATDPMGVSTVASTTVLLGGCDPIDFNGDGLFPDTADIDDFLNVFSGGPCSTGTCGDIDFNNDGLFPDTADIDSLLRVFSGGACA